MRWLAAGVAVFVLTLSPLPVQAASADTVEHQVLDWVNDARVDQGLQPLRYSAVLWDIAAYRSGRMASTNALSHSVAGNVGSQLTARHLPWYAYGEDIGYSPQKSITSAASELFRLWKASSGHWTLMMSSRYNYVGVGLHYRASNHRWYSSIVFAETRDMSPARASMVDSERSGTSVTWLWRGYDPALQTHTSGVRDYELQIRSDWNAFHTSVRATTATARTWSGLSHGHWYGVRVRATDRSGLVGPYSGEIRVWVP